MAKKDNSGLEDALKQKRDKEQETNASFDWDLYSESDDSDFESDDSDPADMFTNADTDGDGFLSKEGDFLWQCF